MDFKRNIFWIAIAIVVLAGVGVWYVMITPVWAAASKSTNVYDSMVIRQRPVDIEDHKLVFWFHFQSAVEYAVSS